MATQDPEDGNCRSCGGVLNITDVDDVSMNVECEACGDNYDVETDAFGDGCMKYYFQILADRMMNGEGDDDE